MTYKIYIYIYIYIILYYLFTVLQESTYFVMIQNYDYFSKWNVKSSKIYTLWKIHIYSTMINTKHVIIITLKTSCKKILFKNSFIWKNENDYKKKTHNPFIK